MSHPEVKILGGDLVISLPVDALIFGATHGRYFDNFPDGEAPVVSDPLLFAQAICEELMAEEEDGSTLVHLMLDKAAENAFENGCDGVD